MGALQKCRDREGDDRPILRTDIFVLDGAADHRVSEPVVSDGLLDER